MPTGVRILIDCGRELSSEELTFLREAFSRDLSLTSEDFYIDGPFMPVGNHDNEFIPEGDSPASMWLDLNLCKSYYGPGYERGDLDLFIRAAEWIEKNLSSTAIYYGHDVSEEGFVLFDRANREALRRGK